MRKKILFSFLVLVMVMTLFGGVNGAFANGQDTCPDGNGWTKIDSDDLSLYPVAGADAYCFKAGSDQSQGCEGGLFDAIPPGGFGTGGYCGLSHWSYHLGQTDTPTPTPPTDTPTPTATPPDGRYTTVDPTSRCYDGDRWTIRVQAPVDVKIVIRDKSEKVAEGWGNWKVSLPPGTYYWSVAVPGSTPIQGPTEGKLVVALCPVDTGGGENNQGLIIGITGLVIGGAMILGSMKGKAKKLSS